MVVIGFFQNLIENLGSLVDFITKPLGEINEAITFEPFASFSIMALLGSSLVLTLGVLLAIHLIRLFVGG